MSAAVAAAPAPGGAARDAGLARRLAPALLVLACLACYARSLRGPFLFDDASFSLQEGISLRNRPVVRASIALNRWISATDTLGYHLVNVAVHALAALALYGLVRRVLESAPRAPRVEPAPFALATALLWAVHPLQTESVAYISQRAESLGGLFVLLVLYAFVRSLEGASVGKWRAASVAALVVGMGTKEIVATAPLLALLLDRALYSGSFLGALRARPGYYAALAAATLASFAWFVAPLLFADSTSGFNVETVGAAAYARTQPGVIWHYLSLAAWPRGQCLDLMWPLAERPGEWVPQSLALGALGGATLWALWRNSWLGLAGAWLFVTLAPTSSFVPIQDPAVEHRMYLPLAAVVVVAVAALRALAARRPRAWLAACALLALALCAVTILRNRVYTSAIAMWSDVVERAPHNWRGHLSLGMALLDAGENERAAAALERSIELGPRPNTFLYLGRARSRMGAHDAALSAFDQADRMRPLHAETLLDRGIAYLRKGDPRAVADLERSAALEPTPTAYFNLGVAALNAGDAPRAERHFRRALELLPDSPQSHGGLGRALLLQGRRAEAAEALERALALRPDDAELRALLAESRAAPRERR